MSCVEAAVFVETHRPPIAEPGGPLEALPAVGIPSGVAVSGHSPFFLRFALLDALH